MKKLYISLFLAISTLYAISIQNVNDNIDKLVSSINKGDTNQSNKLIELLTITIQDCSFEEMDKRTNDNSYISPFIKELPKSLNYDTFINKEDKLRDKFHQVFKAIEDVQNKIATKKYATALKIVITGFNVYKSAIDLIKTDYDLYELVQLPSNLSNTVDSYKKDAEIIQKKFDNIKDEKKKLEYLEDFKNKLINLTYKIRSIRTYLHSKENELTKLSTTIKSCNNSIDFLNHTLYVKVSENATSADVSKYAEELNHLKTALSGGKIGIYQYNTEKEAIWEEINNICSKVDECNGAEQIQENFFQYCYTRDQTKNECITPNPDSNETYYPLEWTISDGNNQDVIISPTIDDYTLLLLYKDKWNDFLSLKKDFIDKFEKLITSINKSDILLEGNKYTLRPIELKEVDVKDEFDSLFNGKKPSECGIFDLDGNFSNSVVTDLYNSSIYNEKTPSKGPNILCGSHCSNEEFFYNNDLTKIFWQNKMEDYFSYLQKYIKSFYYTAILSYSSKPNCNSSFDHCKFAILLLSEDKIDDIAYNIKKLSNDAIDFSNDFTDMSHKLSDIETLANELIELFKTLKNYENTIGFNDFNFDIPLANTNKTELFLYTDISKTKFLNSYCLLNSVISSIEDTKAEALRLQNLSSAYWREWMDEYYDGIEDILAFNHDLKNGKADILDYINQLSKMENYATILGYLRGDISFLLREIGEGEKSNLYETARGINNNYQSFIKLSTDIYSTILKNFTKIFAKIASGDSFGSKDIFSGDYPVFKGHKDLIDKMLEHYWPICSYGYGRSDSTFKNYLNYDAIADKLPRVKNLIDTYYTNEYKPSLLKKSDIILTESKAFPIAINGKGKVSFYVKFKKLNGTFQPMNIELATLIPEENYIIKPYDGFSNMSTGGIKGKYYTSANNEGKYKFTFEFLSGTISVYDSNGKVVDTIPIKDFYIRVYMRSDKNPNVRFNGEDKNAVMFHIVNLKYNKELDKNSNGIDDKWEQTHDINDVNADNDNDGLSNKEEYLLGTDPNKADSDGDGISDADEVKYGLNPIESNDSLSDKDKDGISNIDEIKNGFDPSDKNSPTDIIYAQTKQSDNDKLVVDFYVRSIKAINNDNIKINIPDGFEYISCTSLIENNVSCDNEEINILQLGTGEHHIAQISIKRLDETIAKFILPIKSCGALYGITLKFNIPKTTLSYTFDLEKGWHLLANPFIDDINVFDFDKAAIVWAYKDNNWSGYSKEYDLKKIDIKKLEKIRDNDGFWVYIDHQDQIKVKGERFGYNLFKTIDKGWNLKGSNINLSVKSLKFLFPNFEIVWAYKDGYWKVYSIDEKINKEIQNKIEILNNISKYEGFWILTK